MPPSMQSCSHGPARIQSSGPRTTPTLPPHHPPAACPPPGATSHYRPRAPKAPVAATGEAGSVGQAEEAGQEGQEGQPRQRLQAGDAGQGECEGEGKMHKAGGADALLGHSGTAYAEDYTAAGPTSRSSSPARAPSPPPEAWHPSWHHTIGPSSTLHGCVSASLSLVLAPCRGGTHGRSGMPSTTGSPIRCADSAMGHTMGVS